MHEEIDALFSLRGKLAIVTGGSANLGRDAADILAAAGADLAITSRDFEKARAACSELEALHGIEARPLALNHADPASVDKAVAEIEAWRGAADILVNNAGGGSGASVAELFERDPEDMREMLASNLFGTLLCCRGFGRAMAARGKGKIVNFASIAGLVGRDRRVYAGTDMKGQPVDYAAAKGGVIALTLDLAGYLGPRGVNVNALSPGGFERGQHKRFVAGYADRTPLGRMGRDGVDLKGPILFLCSPASDYVHGHNLVVDGGFSVWK
ncbi:SDR family oxidoreductase [Arsenicitalea aurantiaca]|uniref:SDR family oxidoreductase n=1 Tax=Arsenicitalea aurantiaca TaxID=1783274 RepID=A0A433XLA2_9HYPH|nr:SDR family oxidoreductase [Arsenicitalea aurantiaca]RUT34862.1 SDR family oxidoreductase [Arsenicitalea aurantiaca]